MQMLISIIGILITIFFVIGTHESAHFLTAKLLGVKVLRFSIGFGKSLFSWHDKSGTEYILALIPLGGYVQMLDDTEGEVAPEDRQFAYNHQPFYKKFMIVLAGPLTNIICALVLYWIIFMIGFVTLKPIIGSITPDSIAAKAGMQPNQQIISVDHDPTQTWMGIIFRLIAHAGDEDQLLITVKDILPSKNEPKTLTLDIKSWRMEKLTPDPLTSLGFTPYQPTIPLIIGFMKPDSPAFLSKLKINDSIVAMNNKPVADWNELITFIYKHPSETMTFTIKREGKTMQIPVEIGYKRDMFFKKHGFLGIGPTFEWPKEYLQTIQYGPTAALGHAWKEITNFTYFNFVLIEKLITGKLSVKSLGGPITIFENAGDALNNGMLSFVAFLAFLSISIGVVNLLPIPGLDGGHLFIQLIELIIRRPVPEKVLMVSYRCGFALLIFVLVQALWNDILRLY